ncbi:MAG: DEAD/DEAH box helicase [Treponema sp.]|jgi:ATP-dependent RNA helicase RhlB|nr:DEAD/DEAH box helicase [Treponema sp.]
MEFTELNLHNDLQKGIVEAGYLICTPVQEQVLGNAFNGQDLYVQSQTGTGKTAAFLIVIFQRLLTESLLHGKKALVMAPTRELAVQIEEEAKLLAKHLPFKIGSFYGGVGYGQQQQLLRGNVQILVGTPGRVLDLNASGQMNLMDIAFLVIDEADRMFDMGFYPDLRKLIKAVPPVDRRQTMLFSATLNTWVKNLAYEYTKTPFEIEIAPETVTVEEVEQLLYHVPSEDKMKLLLGVLERERPESAIIFCNTKRYTEIIAKRLKVNGYKVEFIMGDLPQSKRLKIIEELKAGKTPFLAATDVAARGLDIEGLGLVVNYDLPAEAENYVHRIGRTARAGKTGKAVSFASEQDVYELAAIERYIEMKIPSEVAGEHLYAEDKSARAGSRDQNRSEPDPARGDAARRGGQWLWKEGNRRGSTSRESLSRDSLSRDSSRRDPSRRDSPLRDASRDDKARQADESARTSEKPAKNKRRGFPPTQESFEQMNGVDSGDLSLMPFEKRMAYYRAKYSANGADDAGSAGAETTAAGTEGKPRQDVAHKRKSRRSRQRKRAPVELTSGSAAADSVLDSVSGKAVKKGARGEAAAGKQPVKPAKTTTPPAVDMEKTAKKGFFAKLLGVFKKNN